MPRAEGSLAASRQEKRGVVVAMPRGSTRYSHSRRSARSGAPMREPSMQPARPRAKSAETIRSASGAMHFESMGGIVAETGRRCQREKGR